MDKEELKSLRWQIKWALFWILILLLLASLFLIFNDDDKIKIQFKMIKKDIA